MTSPDDNEREDNGGLYGPTESDIERFNREDDEYLDGRKQDAKSALWKLIAGSVFMLLVASMFLNILLPAFSRNRHIVVGPERIAATVVQVFDGRTISVEIDGIERTVRYIGVETPIFGDRWYQLGIDTNTRWLLGKDVELEADDLDADREGRLLRYVYLDGAMINLNLVAVGLSKVAEFGTNTRYMEQFEEREDSARSGAIGVWEETGPQRSTMRNSPANIPSERSPLTSGRA